MPLALWFALVSFDFHVLSSVGGFSKGTYRRTPNGTPADLLCGPFWLLLSWALQTSPPFLASCPKHAPQQIYINLCEWNMVYCCYCSAWALFCWFGIARLLRLWLDCGWTYCVFFTRPICNPPTYFASATGSATAIFARAVPADPLANHHHMSPMSFGSCTRNLGCQWSQKTLWPILMPLFGNTHCIAQIDKIWRKCFICQESQIDPWPWYFWKVSRYTSHFYRDTFAKACPPLGRKVHIPTICITIRLLFVPRCFCRVLGSGVVGTPPNLDTIWTNLVNFACFGAEKLTNFGTLFFFSEKYLIFSKMRFGGRETYV